MLQYRSEYMYDDAVGELGISKSTEDEFESDSSAVFDSVAAAINSKKFGFLKLLDDESQIEASRRMLEHVRWADTLVVVGIGGSDLGGRALQNALSHFNPPLEVIFHGDSTDPADIDRLLRQIELDGTVFNIISKSGGTVETMAQYVYFKQLYLDRGEDWQKHFVFTTGAAGALHDEAEKHGVHTLLIPEEVGGRFSVLSVVGLFPALAMGVEVSALRAGAREALKQSVSHQRESAAFMIAEEQYLLYQQKTKAVVLFPYSSRLNEFARWFRQLWAESLGKKKTGVLPIQARGPADQHSQLQFYTQGVPLASFLFIRVDDHNSSHVIESVDVEGLEYLSGKDLAEIINFEQEATELSLVKAGRPCATIEVSEIDAYTMGELFMTFELAVVYLAEFLSVDAFDQPGVEESKEFIYALLGRDGFEDKLSEIERLTGEKSV